MILQVVALLDTAAGVFGNPMCFRSNGEAIRSFIDAVKDTKQDTDLSRHPEDFHLCVIGTYNNESGSLLPTESMIDSRIFAGKDVIAMHQS